MSIDQDKFLRVAEYVFPIGLVAYSGMAEWWWYHGRDFITVAGIIVGMASTLSITILRHFEVRHDVKSLYNHLERLHLHKIEMLSALQKTCDKLDTVNIRLESVVTRLADCFPCIEKKGHAQDS